VKDGALPDPLRPHYVVFPYWELGMNVNTPEDIGRAEALLTELSGDKDKRMRG
jgi:GTP:adenosylcobinamide-phosphate guanylyltransferase